MEAERDMNRQALRAKADGVACALPQTETARPMKLKFNLLPVGAAISLALLVVLAVNLAGLLAVDDPVATLGVSLAAYETQVSNNIVAILFVLIVDFFAALA